MSDEQEPQLILGNRAVQTTSPDNSRISLLLWGMAGCGKTTLAATAPGKKLWILFDPDGTLVLQGRKDVLVLDLSGEKHSIIERFKLDDPFNMERMLIDHPEIETVVVDSVTSLTLLATENAVHHVKSATIENPGVKGYGHRSALVLRACVSLMRLTKRLNRNIILIAHEDTPTTNDDGVVMYISVSLSPKMTNNVGMQLSEIWWMSDTGKERRIAVRPVRSRTPMKSRMWDVSGSGEFIWRYDAAKWEGPGISDWFEMWKNNGGKKLPLPK